MLQTLVQRWSEMLAKALEMHPGYRILSVEGERDYSESASENDENADIVAWAKRFGEADLFL